jgi:predicted metal-binding membrane protein
MQESQSPSSNNNRVVVLATLAILCLLAWTYLLYMGWGMAHMDVGVDMAIMPRMVSWKAADLVLVFAMWAIMMVAMMLPSAAPMFLLFGALSRQLEQARSSIEIIVFGGGYLAVWSGFSLLATFAQWGLLEARLMSPMMETSSPLLGGALLVAAGLFQFTPFKRGCLAKCRSPVAFLVAEWRSGLFGAWIMGLRHGLFCLGCCWIAMLLLFVLGVMNVFWIATLAAFVLLERTLPNVRWFSAATGVLFIGWGLALLAGVGPVG